MDKNNIEICRKEFPKTKLQNLLIDNTYRDLQKKYGFNERIFSQLAKEYGIKKDYRVIRKKCKKLDIDEKEVLHLYNECKYSLRRIASLYNTTHKTIKNILIKNGCQIRSGYSMEYYSYQPGICNRGYRGTTDYYHIDGNGYVCLYVDGRIIREHRYVMEQHLGRKLSCDEYVHHIDFNKTNNQIENLFLFKIEGNMMHQFYHSYIRHNEMLSPDEFLSKYKTKILKFLSKENLQKLYLKQKLSIAEISALSSEIHGIHITRPVITKKLKKYDLYNKRNTYVNQYDKNKEQEQCA